jgi:hypothetical protein
MKKTAAAIFGQADYLSPAEWGLFVYSQWDEFSRRLAEHIRSAR